MLLSLSVSSELIIHLEFGFRYVPKWVAAVGMAYNLLAYYLTCPLIILEV